MAAGRSVPREHIYSVGELTRNVKGMLESAFQGVWVEGELSGGKIHARSGHFYGTLKDEQAQLDLVMWKGQVNRLGFALEDGTHYLCFGNLTVYEPRGTYQLALQKVEPAGLGALQLQFEQLKKTLTAEGLFEERHKKPLPAFPCRIGIVTSAAGAALRDILTVLQRRFAGLEILVHDTKVQGDGAGEDVARGIDVLDRLGECDVLIVGRGGGSLEDLWAFNTEPVARAIFAAHTPVISAVGHEVDYTIADFVADVRAPTPSAAAEIVVQERGAIVDRLADQRRRLTAAIGAACDNVTHRIESLRGRYGMRRAEDLLGQRVQRLDHASARLKAASPIARLKDQTRRLAAARGGLRANSPERRIPHIIKDLQVVRARLARVAAGALTRADGRFRGLVAQLDALSPLRVLARGYSVTSAAGGTVVTDAGTVAPGELVDIRLHRGRLGARVETVRENDDG